MKKIFPLFLVAMFLSWSLAFADLTPTESSADVSYMPGLSTSNVSDGEFVIDVENVIYNNVDPTGSVDAAPVTQIGNQLPVISDYHDSVYVFDCETPSGDNGCLGVEFDGTYFWVTGRNASGGDVHKLHKFDSSGNLITSYNQGTTTTWGWRDLTWDGTYLYASDENEFARIDPTTGAKVGTLPKPTGLNPVRALAFDPATDHFWSANFSSDIYEFDSTGYIHNQYTNSKAIYGMAWDNVSTDGPWLWVFSQDGVAPLLMEISQFNPSTGAYTGVSFQGSLPTGHTEAMAGGACFTNEWDPSIEALFVLGQGTPTDFVYGYDMFPIVADTTLGSCCNDNNGQCVDSVLATQCPTGSPGVRWTANTLCADLQPPCGSIFGACCDDQGNCTQTTEQDCPGLWLEETPCDPNPCPVPPPCTLVCPTNGIPEGEPDCYEDYNDTTNGGCNSEPPVFGSISPGDTICGTAGTFIAHDTSGAPVNSRDTDWYALTVTADAMLFFHGVAEFDLQLLIIDAGSQDCIDYVVGPGIQIEACSTGVVSMPVTPGVYWLWAGPANFIGVACGSDYQVWAELGASPTGACCVGTDCVATNTMSECDALQGNWYIGETCPDFQCPILVDCNNAIYMNGLPLGNIYASQCEYDYAFAAGVADDFVLPGSDPVTLEYVVAWIGFWNAEPLATPADCEGVNVTIYANDPATSAPGGKPVHPPDSTCAHVELIPDGVVYTVQLAQGSYGYVDDGTGWRYMMPVNVTLDAGVTYWLEVEPIMQPFATYGQSGMVDTDQQQGAFSMYIFELLGTLVWTPRPENVDMAFCLLAEGGGGCDYVPGDVNGSSSYNGLDVTYGVNFFKGGSSPLCPVCPPCNSWHYCGDVNGSCTYNGLDITYGVAYFKGGPSPIYCQDCPPNP